MTDVDSAIKRVENDEEYAVSIADGRTCQQVLFDDRAALAAEVKRLREKYEPDVCPHCLNDPPAHHVCPRCLRRSAP